jgi:hypothetical protein
MATGAIRGKKSATVKIQLSESGIITLHNYAWPEKFKAWIDSLRPLHRPIICTEYMASDNGSTFDTIRPITKQENVGAINWDLVAGKMQTHRPWDSRQRPYVLIQPTVWFLGVFKQDDTPYREREVDLDEAAERPRNAGQTSVGA